MQLQTKLTTNHEIYVYVFIVIYQTINVKVTLHALSLFLALSNSSHFKLVFTFFKGNIDILLKHTLEYILY